MYLKLYSWLIAECRKCCLPTRKANPTSITNECAEMGLPVKCEERAARGALRRKKSVLFFFLPFTETPEKRPPHSLAQCCLSARARWNCSTHYMAMEKVHTEAGKAES